MTTQHTLKCLGSGVEIQDVGLPLDSGRVNGTALLRTIFAEQRFNIGSEADGLFRFASWLPINRKLSGSSAPITYKSTGLAARIGLENLYITFSGFWPERGIEMRTGTFKECEAFSVCARLPEDFDDVLVVASAGNTARAFVRVCSMNNIPLLVFVPEKNLSSIWCDHEVNPCVKLVAVRGDSDYLDAIQMARRISQIDGFVAEGGAKNVARRDGMGCTVLSAVSTIGHIPDFYFQAVGSGTGAIAAWEAVNRLHGDGRFGRDKMRLFVSQNAPFLIIYDSWKRGGRELIEVDADTARKLVSQTHAKVLSNRQPPYGITGGLYDALVDTDGEVMAVSNSEVLKASEMFLETEGVDLAPAASVAVASLIGAAKENVINSKSVIMLNVTGGGFDLLKKQMVLNSVEPSAVVPRDNIDKAVETTLSLFQ